MTTIVYSVHQKYTECVYPISDGYMYCAHVKHVKINKLRNEIYKLSVLILTLYIRVIVIVNFIVLCILLTNLCQYSGNISRNSYKLRFSYMLSQCFCIYTGSFLFSMYTQLKKILILYNLVKLQYNMYCRRRWIQNTGKNVN